MKFSRAKLQHLKWLRRKELIRINCFIMVALFLIVLLFMGFPIVSHAESTTYLKDKYFMHDLINSQGFVSRNGQSGYYDLNTGGSTFNQFRVSLVDSYDIYYNSYYQSVKSLFDNVSLDSIVSLSTNGINSLSKFDDLNLYIYTRPDDSTHLYFGFCSTSALGLGFDNHRFYNNYNGTYVYDISNKQLSFNGNSMTNFEYLLYCSGYVYWYNWSGGTAPDINYTHIDGTCGHGSGGANIVDNTPIINHEKPYQGSCVYMQYSNLNTGNMHIVVKSDEYQKTENASIKLKCSVSCQIRQNSSSYRSNNGIDGPYQNNFSVPNEVFNIGPYVEYKIPLSSFNNTGDYTISLEDINKGLWNSNEKTLYSFNSCFENTSQGLSQVQKSFNFALLSIVNFMYPYENIADTSFTLLSESWDVQCVFCIGDHEEIFDSFQLDMISGSIDNQDYSLPNEDDIKNALDVDVVPNNYTPQPYLPYYPQAVNITVPNSNSDVNNDIDNNSQDNDNITVSGGENSVNVVTNINQGNKYPEKGVLQSFVRIINNDKNNTVNDIDTLIGGSSYIQLMNNALVAVPDQVWSIWITALKAILGIAVSAFFLKILINWAT